MKLYASPLTMAILFVTLVVAQIDTTDVVDVLNDATTATTDAVVAFQAALKNPASLIISVPSLVISIASLITTLEHNWSGLNGNNGKYTPSDQETICEALEELIESQENLVEVLIGKKGLLSSNIFTAPIAAVLSELQPVVKSFITTVVGTAPNCRGIVVEGVSTLEHALNGVIEVISLGSFS